MNGARRGTGGRVIVALDLPDAGAALDMVQRIGPACTFYKVGLELYTAEGPEVVRSLRDRGKDVFLDLKLHDIPNTVARATARAGDLGVRFLTVHALGGAPMLAAAVGAAPESMTILGVTVLTSLDAPELGTLFARRVDRVGAEAARLARVVRGAGAGGVVCAAAEADLMREVLGRGACIVTPGIRGAGQSRHDQRRVRTAAEAFASGATHIVVGRPVTTDPDPAAACARLAAEGTPSADRRYISDPTT